MKQTLIAFMLFCTLGTKAQTKVPHNYPALGNLQLLASEGRGAETNSFTKDQTVVLQLLLLNANAAEPVKAGSCELRIDLGKSLQLPQAGRETHLPLSQFFHWDIVQEDGRTELVGKLVADLPADFADGLSVSLTAAETGASTVKAVVWTPLERSKHATLQSLDYSVERKK